ncbi:alpha/beta fold hydrolase [Streptomyces sp. NPDC052016]|uniref:alpha/beta fold hydrolase n=1 Tax=unclassified Streptomyces TaxID=2593676 RepID=UPI0034342F2E
MRLHTREWGTGERVAVLVHGIMADHRTWHDLVPVLTDRGYRVLAVDLRGHGASARGAYAPRLFAEDLLDTLPRRPELALGHSLGALALALAVEELAPARAVYSEPAWRLAGSDGRLDPALFTLFKRSPRLLTSFARPAVTARRISDRAANDPLPSGGRANGGSVIGGGEGGADGGVLGVGGGVFRRVGEADRIALEQQALGCWDETSALALSSHRLVDHTPDTALVPSLVQVSDPSLLVSAEMRADLVRRGFEVRTVPDAPHAIHRDRFDAFVESLSGWL